MNTTGNELKSLEPARRLFWMFPIVFLQVVFFSVGCGSTGSHDSRIVCGSTTTGSPTQVTRLADLQGRLINPFNSTNAKAIVFIFFEIDCPIANRYAPEIQQLFARYAPQGVDFWLVYPAPERKPAEIARHVKEFQLSLPVLRDPQHNLVKRAGVRVTPEAAVFLCNGRLAYRGRIDDRMVDFGKERHSATRRDLSDVLLAISQGKPVIPQTTPAIGCYISTLPKNLGP